MAGFVTVPYNASTLSRRNNPVKQMSYTINWVKNAHLITMGGTYSRISEYTQSFSTQIIPRVTFGVQSNDPILGIFTSANFPGASSSDLTNAENLYSLLTGRVSGITRSLVLDDQSHTYGASGIVGRLKQQEYGFFIQDTWKATRSLTITAGLRLENQNPFHTLNNTYTRPGYAGLYGISGVGNLFQPGASAGSTPVLTLAGPDTTGYSATHFFSPTAGVAYTIPKYGGWIGKIFSPGGNSVLRGGVSIASVREQFTMPWQNNQGVSLNTSVDPVSTNTASFGPAGSVLFRDPTLPTASVASTPTYPLAVLPGNQIYDYNPNIKARYVASWNVGWQRPIDKDTVVEARYVGNRSARAWLAVNVNELNVVENNFLTQFQAAQNNLAIANGVSVSQLATLTSFKSTNFFNQGLAGQTAVPIISTALAGSANSTLATYVAQGQAGALANSIATNVTQMARLTSGGYAANLFQVNPATGGSAANLTTNQGGSSYNSLQLEVRRRLSKGLLVGGSYTWSHSLALGNILSLRNMDGVTYPSGFDQRHGIKGNWIYELPFGPGKSFLGNPSNRFVRKATEGWQLAGIVRVQSGTPSELISGRLTFNGVDGGVVLHNITTAQLQSMISIQKNPNGLVTYLPQSLINNTLAAFNLIPQAVDTTQPYMGPANTAGQFGNQVFLYGPWFSNLDISMVKRTKIGEKQSIDFRVQALNVFNHANFFLVPNSTGNITVNNLFGQTRNAFNDINSTNNPGARLIDFQLRYSF